MSTTPEANLSDLSSIENTFRLAFVVTQIKLCSVDDADGYTWFAGWEISMAEPKYAGLPT